MDDLEALDTVKADGLADALYDAGITPRLSDNVLNRLINAKASESSTTMQAKTLARHPEAEGSHVSFRAATGHIVQGKLGAVMEAANGQVAIEMDGDIRLVFGNVAVEVWPVGGESWVDNVAKCGRLVGHHMAYGQMTCDQPTGHTSAHVQSHLPPQCPKTRDGIQCSRNFDHKKAGEGHWYSKTANDLRKPVGPTITNYMEYSAEHLYINRERYIGRTVLLSNIGDTVVSGEVTDLWYVKNSASPYPNVVFVIDGKIHALPAPLMVKVAKPARTQCEERWPGDGDAVQCTKHKGHSLPHTY